MPDNLWTLVEPSFHKFQDLPAWISRESKRRQVVPYSQLYDAALTIAGRLRKSGIQPQDTVGITAPNGPEWTAAALAVWKIGANIAPIHIGNSDHDIEIQIAAINPSIMLIHNATSTFPTRMAISLEANLSLIEQEKEQSAVANPGDVAVRIYTSGSTGTPKIVRLSHANHTSNVLAACKIKTFSSDDRFISLLPLSHAMGLTANLLLPLYCGSAVVKPRALAASEILETLVEENISVMIAVPRLFRNIMIGLEKKFEKAGVGLKLYLSVLRKSPQFLKKYLNLPIRKKLGGHINIWVSGGSHLDGRISKYYHALGLPLRQGYGLTETSPLTSIQSEFDPAVESVGKAIENVTVKINSPDKNGHGEVWIKGPNVMLGYENQAHNAESLEDGWFKTGDIGTMDNEGKVTLTGRLKRLIVTEAGKNIYPEELETLLERDSRIKEAGIFEIDMRPVCVLAIDGNNTISKAQAVLKAFNSRVSAHNRITRFAITDELPRTPLGKLALQELPEVFARLEGV